MKTKKQLEKEIEEFKRSADMSFKVKSIAQGMVFDENRKIAEATLTQTNEIIELIEDFMKNKGYMDFSRSNNKKTVRIWTRETQAEILTKIKGEDNEN